MSQDPVPVQFQKDPVLVQTGTEIVFTVITVPQVLSMTWQYQGDVTLGIWTGGNSVIDPVPQFEGRVTLRANQLRIGGAQLRDAGNYSVVVIPNFSTGLIQNSRSIQLRVFGKIMFREHVQSDDRIFQIFFFKVRLYGEVTLTRPTLLIHCHLQHSVQMCLFCDITIYIYLFRFTK